MTRPCASRLRCCSPEPRRRGFHPHSTSPELQGFGSQRMRCSSTPRYRCPTIPAEQLATGALQSATGTERFDSAPSRSKTEAAWSAKPPSRPRSGKGNKKAASLRLGRFCEKMDQARIRPPCPPSPAIASRIAFRVNRAGMSAPGVCRRPSAVRIPPAP